MSIPARWNQLIQSLGMEIGSACAGSDQAQFPILDLLGNLRDTAPEHPDFAHCQTPASEAWEKVVQIIESRQPFSQEHIDWLKELLAKLSGKTADAPAATGTAAPGNTPAPVAEKPADPAHSAEEAPAELTIDLKIDEDVDLLREFITESREHLDNIEQGILVLENQPDDAEMLNTIFRAFHTFKGGAGFLNLIPINRLAHVLESLLDLARQGKLTIDAPVIELILSGRDLLKKFVDEIEGQVSGSRPAATILIPTEMLKSEVTDMIEQTNGGGVKPKPAPTAAPATPKDVTLPETAPAAPAIEDPVSAPAPVEVAAAPVEATAAMPNATPASNPAAARTVNNNAMIKVDTAKLDALLDLVGEMVIAQSLVTQNQDQHAQAGVQFARNMAQLSRITRELQRVSMALRMVPIRGVFQKMARVARDISAKQNKKVQFLTSGEDTELDRGVVEELSDPLLHMIRNSMDHGIESAEKRAAAGKAAVGSLHLRAYHQGGNIVVEIQDDGAGLNRDRILAKAIERGLTRSDAKLTDEEIYSFIFAAGFSTAEKVTDLSGRGVGLDVVRRNLERLRGRVDISSKAGKGTIFKISLPLTLAIIDGLIFKVGDERYILPALAVCESFRPTSGMITRVHNRAEVVNVRGRLIPLLRLHELFNITPSSTDPLKGIIVVVQSGANLRCLLVDQLLHKQEVVIKNLNDMMVHKNRALAGATILGDGRVGLILDVNALTQEEGQAFSKAA